MRLLLDTHSFLWFIAGSDKISVAARDLIEGMPIVGADGAFDAYTVTRMW